MPVLVSTGCAAVAITPVKECCALVCWEHAVSPTASLGLREAQHADGGLRDGEEAQCRIPRVRCSCSHTEKL